MQPLALLPWEPTQIHSAAPAELLQPEELLQLLRRRAELPQPLHSSSEGKLALLELSPRARSSGGAIRSRRLSDDA